MKNLDPGDVNLAQLERIAEEFRTTISTTIHRVVDIGIHICALVRSENGRLKSFHLGPDFPFRIREMRSALDRDSGAGKFFREGTVVEREADVPADTWIENRRLTGSETIRELTIPMPNYNSALTMLWIVPGSKLDRLAAE